MSELLKVNVNDKTEKKNDLTYLSWAWAWAEVLKIDPLAVWEPLYFGPESHRVPYLMLPDGSMMVGVAVQMQGSRRECLLPVMNHRNQAIKNPDAFAVNTAMMRCLAKTIAMHGLGLYIYAGEDLPEADTLTEAALLEAAKAAAAKGLAAYAAFWAATDRAGHEVLMPHHAALKAAAQARGAE